MTWLLLYQTQLNTVNCTHLAVQSSLSSVLSERTMRSRVAT
jgi:hypothetical protein